MRWKLRCRKFYQSKLMKNWKFLLPAIWHSYPAISRSILTTAPGLLHCLHHLIFCLAHGVVCFLAEFESSVYISIQFELHGPVQSMHYGQWPCHFINACPFWWDWRPSLLYIITIVLVCHRSDLFIVCL